MKFLTYVAWAIRNAMTDCNCTDLTQFEQRMVDKNDVPVSREYIWIMFPQMVNGCSGLKPLLRPNISNDGAIFTAKKG